MKIFGLKSCDSCRAALKSLTQAGHVPELIDVRAAPLSSDQMATFFETFGDALVNKRSTTWRNLTEVERAMPIPDLLSHAPSVMKRPVIETPSGDLLLGWGKDTQKALGLPG